MGKQEETERREAWSGMEDLMTTSVDPRERLHILKRTVSHLPQGGFLKRT